MKYNFRSSDSLTVPRCLTAYIFLLQSLKGAVFGRLLLPGTEYNINDVKLAASREPATFSSLILSDLLWWQQWCSWLH